MGGCYTAPVLWWVSSTSAREFSNEIVVFKCKEHGFSSWDFSAGVYYTFGTESLYTRNRFCEEFSGYFSIRRLSLTHHLRRIGV